MAQFMHMHIHEQNCIPTMTYSSVCKGDCVSGHNCHLNSQNNTTVLTTVHFVPVYNGTLTKQSLAFTVYTVAPETVINNVQSILSVSHDPYDYLIFYLYMLTI